MRDRTNDSDLAHHIWTSPLCDTHEHLWPEHHYLEHGPDILQSLFDNYVAADLVVAGATQAEVDALVDAGNPDLRGRFEPIQPAWEAVRHTGYGEAVRTIGRLLYDMDEVTADTIEASLPIHAQFEQPGERLRLLRDVANLDHVQVDDMTHPVEPDSSGPDFFLYDISWADFCSGTPELENIATETGIEVRDLSSLRNAMESIFDRYAAIAVAVKAQHAYNRTLEWRARTDLEAARALTAYLQNPARFTGPERLCLGDWCWAKGVELAIEHDLPFKLHTGYYAGHSRMPVDYIRSGNLCDLLAQYLDARFVLMHIAYPYTEELIALAGCRSDNIDCTQLILRQFF